MKVSTKGAGYYCPTSWTMAPGAGVRGPTSPHRRPSGPGAHNEEQTDARVMPLSACPHGQPVRRLERQPVRLHLRGRCPTGQPAHVNRDRRLPGVQVRPGALCRKMEPTHQLAIDRYIEYLHIHFVQIYTE